QISGLAIVQLSTSPPLNLALPHPGHASPTIVLTLFLFHLPPPPLFLSLLLFAAADSLPLPEGHHLTILGATLEVIQLCTGIAVPN
ncbi:hypothetical protein KUCAC02_019120, partial [Chaenocephalus aceratus]